LYSILLKFLIVRQKNLSSCDLRWSGTIPTYAFGVRTQALCRWWWTFH
jgi:hypothetical protein